MLRFQALCRSVKLCLLDFSEFTWAHFKDFVYSRRHDRVPGVILSCVIAHLNASLARYNLSLLESCLLMLTANLKVFVECFELPVLVRCMVWLNPLKCGMIRLTFNDGFSDVLFDSKRKTYFLAQF